MSTNPMLIRGMVVISIALLLCIVTIALPYWWTNRAFSSSGAVGYDYGVFKVCTDVTSLYRYSSSSRATDTQCVSIEDPPSWLQGVQALKVVSILIICGCLPLLVLYCTLLKNKHTLLTVCSVGLFVAGLLWGIGTLVFLAMKLVNLKVGIGMPHACFYLALVAEGMMTSSGRLVLRARPNDNANIAPDNTQANGNVMITSTPGITSISAVSTPQMATTGVMVPMNQGMVPPGYYGMTNMQQPNVYLQMSPVQTPEIPRDQNTVNMSKNNVYEQP